VTQRGDRARGQAGQIHAEVRQAEEVSEPSLLAAGYPGGELPRILAEAQAIVGGAAGGAGPTAGDCPREEPNVKP